MRLRSAIPFLLLASASTALLCGSCARKPAVTVTKVSPTPGAPVILITVDTLRADRLPLYGFTGVETPAFSALAKDGILAEQAFAHVPLTVPSHGTIFTGLLPAQNGLRDNLGYRLSPAAATLAETLKSQGYETGAAVSSIVLTAATTGLGRGFDAWDDAIELPGDATPIGRVQRAGDATLDSLLAWLSGRTSKKVFAFLHLYEPHSPYDPPEPFKSRYASDPYVGEIAAADAIVGRFVAELKKRGLYDDALIVLLSDHGEGLGDHGESEHGVFLYREALHVPLVLKLPKGALAGRTIASPVGLRDVAPSILGLVAPGAAPAPEGSADLVALAGGAAAPERTLYAESLFPRIHFGWSELFSAADGRFRYVKAPKPELYDGAGDPGEKLNLVAEKPPALRRLVVALEAFHPTFAPPSSADPEQAKKLASLGYLSAAPASADGPLPDPKDQLETFERIKTGLKLMIRGRPDEALPYLDAALKENPRMMDVWEVRSQTLEKLGRMDEALASLKKSVELSPAGSPVYLVAVANLALRMGKLDDAIAHARLAGQAGDAAAEEILARAYLAKGDLASAATHATTSLASPRNRSRGLLVLSRIELARGHERKALQLTDSFAAARGGHPTDAGFHWLRGDLFARAGRFDESEKEFREEVALHPGNTNGWTSLVALLASRGRREEARAAAAALVAARPTPDGLASATKALVAVGDAAGAAQLSRDARAK